MKDVLYYELLYPNETVNSNRYSQQLIRLNQEIERNRPKSSEIVYWQRKMSREIAP